MHLGQWRVRAAMTALALTFCLLGAEVAPAAADDPIPTPEPTEITEAAPTGEAPTPEPTVESDAVRKVNSLLQRRWHDARIGKAFSMLVIDAQTGEVISEHNPTRAMHAASNMKMVTAVNALATMGPDKRFTTKVLGGATRNDVILQGAGDPLLSTSGLRQLADATARGLRKGQRVVVHVDGDLFAPRSKGPGWLDYSVASVQALARLGDNTKTPSRNAANVFASRLRAHGIRARVGANRDAAAEAPVIATARGHTVAESLAVMLSLSESNIAEVLFRQTAIATGNAPTWAGGRQAALATLASLGVATDDVQLWDGSGLSRKDLLTPRFLTSVLRVAKVQQPERFAAMFARSALPVAGVSGTLARPYGRYSTKPSICATGRVQAKTGTLFDTIALSGVAESQEGLRIFSFIVNHRPHRFTPLSTRRAIDGLAATVVGCWT